MRKHESKMPVPHLPYQKQAPVWRTKRFLIPLGTIIAGIAAQQAGWLDGDAIRAIVESFAEEIPAEFPTPQVVE